MHRRAILVLFLVGVSLHSLSGCNAEVKSDAPKAAQDDETLTAEAAKRALLNMDAGEIPPGVIVPDAKANSIVVATGDESADGRWVCDLKAKTFHIFATYPNAPRHRFNHVAGEFRRGPDGKWLAKVTESSPGH